MRTKFRTYCCRLVAASFLAILFSIGFAVFSSQQHVAYAQGILHRLDGEDAQQCQNTTPPRNMPSSQTSIDGFPPLGSVVVVDSNQGSGCDEMKWARVQNADTSKPTFLKATITVVNDPADPGRNGLSFTDADFGNSRERSPMIWCPEGSCVAEATGTIYVPRSGIYQLYDPVTATT